MNLLSLEVNSHELVPVFDPNVNQYTIHYTSDENTISVTALRHKKASWVKRYNIKYVYLDGTEEYEMVEHGTIPYSALIEYSFDVNKTGIDYVLFPVIVEYEGNRQTYTIKAMCDD